MVRNTIFEQRNGDRGNVLNIVFLFTDGKPNMFDDMRNRHPPEYTNDTLKAIVSDIQKMKL